MTEYKPHNTTIEQIIDDMHTIYVRLSNEINSEVREANTYEAITQHKEELEQLNKDFETVYDALKILEYY